MKNDLRYKTFSLLLQRRKRLTQRLEKALVAARTGLRLAHEELAAKEGEFFDHQHKVENHDGRLARLFDVPDGFAATQIMSLRDYRDVLIAQGETLKADVGGAQRVVSEREEALAGAQRDIARNNAQLEALEARLKDIAMAHELAIEDIQDEEAEEAHGARARANAGK
jgi:type III secretion system HrpB7-like protein